MSLSIRAWKKKKIKNQLLIRDSVGIIYPREPELIVNYCLQDARRSGVTSAAATRIPTARTYAGLTTNSTSTKIYRSNVTISTRRRPGRFASKLPNRAHVVSYVRVHLCFCLHDEKHYSLRRCEWSATWNRYETRITLRKMRCLLQTHATW